MLEAKALQLILETNKKANAAEVLKIPGDGRTQWVRIGDELREIPVKPRPREHFTLSLDSMIDYVKGVRGQGSGNSPLIPHPCPLLLVAWGFPNRFCSRRL